MTKDRDSILLITIADLSAYFEPGENTEDSFSRQVYKDTECGAWLSFQYPEGVTFGSDTELPLDLTPDSLTIGSIVEGSDAEFDRKITLPTMGTEIREWIEELEQLCETEWNAANEEVTEE